MLMSAAQVASCVQPHALVLQQCDPQPALAGQQPSCTWLQGATQQGSMLDGMPAQAWQQQAGLDAGAAAQLQASITHLDVSALRAALQGLLVSLPPAEGASSSSATAPVVLQVQDVQQATPVVLQPAQQQQVYTMPSGEQLLLGGTTAGAMQQHTLAGNISNTAIGAAGRSLVLPQPLQNGQTSCYSTGKGQAVTYTVGTAVNNMPGPLTSGHLYSQPLGAGCQQLGGGSSWQVVSENCSSTPYGLVQLPVGSGTADSSSCSAAECSSVVCILSGPSAPLPPSVSISYGQMQGLMGVAAPVSSSVQSPAGPGLQLVPFSNQQQQGVATGNRLVMGHPPPPPPRHSSGGGGYGRVQQHVSRAHHSGTQAEFAVSLGPPASTSTAAAASCVIPGPWADLSLDAALPQLWSNEQVQQARGGRLFNTELRAAWYAAGDPELCAQDMYDFRELKHVLHKLDAKHRVRLSLIRRLHAVADYGSCDLKAVYFEVRCVIIELQQEYVGRLEGARVTDLVRLALVLQEALALGPREVAGPAMAVE